MNNENLPWASRPIPTCDPNVPKVKLPWSKNSNESPKEAPKPSIPNPNPNPNPNVMGTPTVPVFSSETLPPKPTLKRGITTGTVIWGAFLVFFAVMLLIFGVFIPTLDIRYLTIAIPAFLGLMLIIMAAAKSKKS